MFSVKNPADARSALAQDAQAVELDLLLPVLGLAKRTNKFRILLWQHDGFTVKFTEAGKEERWHRRILKVVNEKAIELAIPTQLDPSKL